MFFMGHGSKQVITQILIQSCDECQQGKTPCAFN